MAEGRLHLDPEQMYAKGTAFDARADEFEQLVNTMKNMVVDLTQEWEGQSSQSFYTQFESLEPGFGKTIQLIHDIAQQLRNVSDAMISADQDISNQIKAL